MQLATSLDAGVVVGSGDSHGSEVFAHVAARMDRPLVSHAIAVTSAPDGGWELTRLRWGGMLLEDIHMDDDLALITVAPGQIDVQEAAQPSEVEVLPFAADLDDPDLHRTRVQQRHAPVGGTSLATAPVVIAGGRGVGSAEGFALLEELADLVGGAVGCSRVATNNGWRSHDDQVGQTGTRISPELYIACGISGATQHWVGCMGSKRILAINTDAEAPMVTRADDAVLGDLHEILAAVVELVRARTSVS